MPPSIPPYWYTVSVAFSAGLLLGLLFMWLWMRAVGKSEAETAGYRIAGLESETEQLSEQLRRSEAARESLISENQSLAAKCARLEADRKADAEKIEWLQSTGEAMAERFQTIAGRALRESSSALRREAEHQANAWADRMKGDWSLHQSELRRLVDPVRERLGTLDENIRAMEEKRRGAYEGIEAQIRHLSETHARLQNATVSLTQALKSPTARGRWGELQLRRVVEMAGMTRHVAFSEQVSTNGGRPDMIVHLPGNGILPVDAKTPLAAYLDAEAAEDDDLRKRKMAEHARAFQSRVRELGRKAYWAQFDPAPDIVVMFVPSDICLVAAFEHAPDLLEYAVNRKVLIATPMTLIAMLRSVAWGWQQFQMTENARRIVAQAREMHKRLEIFTRHLVEVGNHLNRAVSGYNKAVHSLDRRLMPLARRFHESGVCETALDPPSPIELRADTLLSENDFADAASPEDEAPVD